MTAIYRDVRGQRAVESRYRDVLSRWPVASQERTVATTAGETFIVSCGPEDAPPTVLLHGAGTNSGMWVHDVQAWSAHRRLHLVDVIGEPGLSAPARPPLSSTAYARWLSEVFDSLGVASAALVGASLGGWLAVDFATRHPDRAERVALQAPGGIGRQKYGAVAMALLLMSFGDRGRAFALRHALGRPAMPDEMFDDMMLIQRHYLPRREPLPRFSDERLRRLTMPLLVVVGADDRILDSRDTARRISRLLPEATVELLEGAGHAPRSDATVRAFLDVRDGDV